MYHAGFISLDKEVINEANSIIYDFIWKDKDKVRRSSLINDIEYGGLKAPHLESRAYDTNTVFLIIKKALFKNPKNENLRAFG